jgi:hypothetical protein
VISATALRSSGLVGGTLPSSGGSQLSPALLELALGDDVAVHLDQDLLEISARSGARQAPTSASALPSNASVRGA